MSGTEALIALADRAVSYGDVERTVDYLRSGLCKLMGSGELKLPERVLRCCPDHYARRLLHRDTEHGYSIVAMTWGPRQGTPLHDHGGLWCVEGVWLGSIEVQQYELREHDGERYRFEKCGSFRAGIGSAGCLIPPHEYHLIRNPGGAPAVSVHIYGGDMSLCHIFEPQESGWYRRRQKTLGLDQ